MLNCWWMYHQDEKLVRQQPNQNRVIVGDQGDNIPYLFVKVSGLNPLNAKEAETTKIGDF